MPAMKHARATLLATAAAALLIAGCGNSSAPPASIGTEHISAKATAGRIAGLRPYLVGRGEETGFDIFGTVTTDATSLDWAEIPGLNPARTLQEVARLRAEGFIGGVSQQLVGVGDPGAGVSTVARFSNPTGAAQAEGELTHQFVKTYNRLRHQPGQFPVPGIPGATGVFALTHQGSAAKIIWVEGNCVLSISNSSRLRSLETQIIAAAQAIYTRTGGKCS